MPDDLDNQIRAAMKVLDEQTPSGYFEAVPNQILARLEDGSMQHGSGTTDIRDKRDALMGPPVVADADDTNKTAKAERDEDSGLHDIRNLAQSTKQRLSSRRSTQNPPINDDVLASSSGSFANIALPQPAKMVALPELEDLPSKQEILAAQKAAAKAKKARAETPVPATRASSSILAPNAEANAALAALTAAPVEAASATPPVRQAFTLPSMERRKSKGPLLAVLGMGVAAAAGGLIFMNMNKSEKSSAASTAPAGQTATADMAAAKEPAQAPAAAAAPAVEAPAPTPPAEEAKADEAAAGSAAAVAAVAEDDDAKHPTKRAKASKKGTVEVEKKDEPKVEQKVEKPDPKPEAKDTKDPKDKKAGGGEGEPSFDALLKEAGVDEKKEVKPKLEKKSLSGDDFKKGMSAIQSKAQGCYKGTQGTASVKLTVGPTGQVTKATVGGQFAGTPEGACIEAAVKGASFPPWDGGPQSFNYSYMLAD